ncbi:hypothetical protein H4S04_005169 [Coemansia sp. S16]|nr:hypothetical protein H4S04_005169 [Coemansia sp. S16]
MTDITVSALPVPVCTTIEDDASTDDMRGRSTSVSTAWRSATVNGHSDFSSSSSSFPFDQQTGLDSPPNQALISRLSQCTESSEAEKVDECLAELQALLDRTTCRSDTLQYALSRHVPRLLVHFKWYVRARAYRLLRRLPSPQSLMYCRQYLELSVMHTLVLDDSAHGEREQGLKFIRWTMQYDDDLWLLNPQVIKTIMAVSEQADDRMRSVCLETLCELLVLAPERLWYVNGIRTLTQAALDGPWSISISIASALAHVFDNPSTRRFIHPGVTLGGVTSALTEPMGKDQILTERAKVAAFMLTQFLKSWSGIQYFLSDGRKVISALVNALSMADSNGKIILGMLLELFGLSDDFDSIQFEQQPRFDVDLLSPFHLPAYAITQTAARTRLLPVDYMRTLLLMTFIDEGLVESLVSSALETKLAEVVDASTTLIKWLSQHPHMPLPEQYVAKFHMLGDLVDRALDDNGSPAVALNAKRIICKIEAIPSLSMGQLPSQAMDAWASSLSSSVFYRQFLRQRRLRAEIRRLSHPQPRPRRGSHAGKPEFGDGPADPNAVPFVKGHAPSGSTSVVGGSRGLAAGLKDNAARVLRSSASTGNLKSGGNAMGGIAGALLSQLTTVNEDASFTSNDSVAANAGVDFAGKGRRSLDILRNPLQQNQPPGTPQNPRGVGGFYGNISALSSPFAMAENSLALTPSGYSNISALSNSTAIDTPATPGHHAFLSNAGSGNSALSVSTPPLIARSRAKSRSRSRNSIVIVNSLGVEETPLSALIQESRVTTEDNPMRWDWPTIRTIILGPISLGRRLPDETSVSGFLSRLSHFFHPSSLEFCDLSRTTSNEEYLEIGRQLIRILISSADGLLLIDESRLLSGIVDEIKKQNSLARKKSREESCFSFARLQMTMSPGYFHFLSEIDQSKGGDSLLERNRLYDAYYQVVELADQILLIQYILSSMSYATEGHARNILRKVASSPHESLRLLVPSFLVYVASDVPCRGGSVTAWAIEVLLSLVFDASPAVRCAAAQSLVLVIDLAAENPYLDPGESDTRFMHLLELRPMLDLAVITDIRPLILRIISDERGFAYLNEQGIVDSEMESWGALEGIYYVQTIELDISRALAYGPLFSSTPDGAMMMTTGSQTPPTPPHLFGELAKCPGGRSFLEDMGIPRLLFETLSNIPWNSALAADVVGLKATLWAIGAMGASRDGYLMLEPYDVIGRLVDVARQAQSMSTRGTCLYALALISRNEFAADAFREKGWLLCSSCYGAYEFAVPPRLESIFEVRDWASGGLLEGTYVFSPDTEDLGEELDSVQKEIIDSVITMSNQVLVNPSSKTLMRLRMSHPHYFRLLPLYLRAMYLLGKYRYRLSARRFVYDIFDVNLATLHQEMLLERRDLVQDTAIASRRFSSSSQHFLHSGVSSEIQRKRASTLQEYSSPSASASTLFPRRPTNGLLDDIRPTARTVGPPLSSNAVGYTRHAQM